MRSLLRAFQVVDHGRKKRIRNAVVERERALATKVNSTCFLMVKRNYDGKRASTRVCVCVCAQALAFGEFSCADGVN